MNWYLTAAPAGRSPHEAVRVLLGPRATREAIDESADIIRNKLWNDYNIDVGFDVDLYTVGYEKPLESSGWFEAMENRRTS